MTSNSAALRVRAASLGVLLAVALGACSSNATPAVSPSPSPIDTRPIVSITVPSDALGDNLVGDPAEHKAMVYLPPAYFASDDPLPVVYYLAGHESPATIQGVRVPESLDDFFQTADPAIVVMVDGLNRFHGSFYVDSPTTGGWSTFLVDDLVPYVDSHFRTIPTRDARGIAGHSMGGFGALDNAMRHSDVFGSVFALAPGLFDENGLATSQMFSSEDHVRGVLALIDDAIALGGDDGLALLAASPSASFDVGYGMAFAPTDVYPYFEYPYSVENGALVRDDAVWARWESGFGGIAAETVEYGDAWRSELGIAFDCGDNDEYRWIPQGCVYLDAQLTGAGIAHRYTTHPGDHGSDNGRRVVDVMLPFFEGVFSGVGDENAAG